MKRRPIYLCVVVLVTVTACGPTYEDGRAAGYAQGVEEGKRAGFDEGKEEGLEEGKEEGKEEGLEEGKEDGKAEVCDEIMIWSADVWTTLTANGTC